MTAGMSSLSERRTLVTPRRFQTLVVGRQAGLRTLVAERYANLWTLVAGRRAGLRTPVAGRCAGLRTPVVGRRAGSRTLLAGRRTDLWTLVAKRRAGLRTLVAGRRAGVLQTGRGDESRAGKQRRRAGIYEWLIAFIFTGSIIIISLIVPQPSIINNSFALFIAPHRSRWRDS